ncbi:MAG: OmpA family protein [Syntrophobacteraceae bacterium]
MRHKWSYLTLLYFLTSCANPQQAAVTKHVENVAMATPAHGKEVALHIYLSRLFGKMLFTRKDCATISIPSDSLFEPHSCEAKPAKWTAPIDTVAAICAKYPRARVTVSAYTDCTHSEEQNLALSELQAWMIKKALVEKGIASRKIRAQGWGEARPVASNATREGRKANRRVTITFSSDQTNRRISPLQPSTQSASEGSSPHRDAGIAATHTVVHLSRNPKLPRVEE